jgi:aryl-alcohol dehydrogenase-like predicted oxidoreductase
VTSSASPDPPWRNLGLTGLHVTHLGLGLAALGRPAYITTGRSVDLGLDRSGEALERRTHTMLDLAYNLGIRYVDAARSYGRAEEFLASWLDARRLRRDDITIASKWGYVYTGGWVIDANVQEVKDHSVSALREQALRSLELLGDRVSLYQVHSATLESGVLSDRAVIEELLALTDRGLTIGLTVSGPAQTDVIRRALAVDFEGRNPFRCVQATWNLLEPSAAPALIEAHDRGWGVIVKEALANGRLTDHSTVPCPRSLRRVADRLGGPTDQVALAAALAQPWADVVLTGAVTPSQLRSNMSALNLDVDTDSLDQLSTLAERRAEYWGTRAKLRWS